MPSKNVKKRNWAFVVYPESAPNSWRDKLQQTGLKCAISPLHDRDMEPDGNPKKAHYHVIICYDGPQTYNAVKALTASLRQPIPQPLESVRGYYRYLCHLDNPDKAQYSKADIVTVNGFDIRDYVELTRTEVVKILGLIHDFIRDNNIIEYSDLLDCLHDGDGLDDWYEVAVSHTLVLASYLRSRREKGRVRDDGRNK
uniref:Replication protein n=1 Tax=uncultured prokaryote TaxID=198431 RepID=A0A0H5QMB6_9ZZZZ|nr:hypothetical protein [uncultured prokaryote]